MARVRMPQACRLVCMVLIASIFALALALGGVFHSASGDVAGLISPINAANATAEADMIILAARYGLPQQVIQVQTP